MYNSFIWTLIIAGETIGLMGIVMLVLYLIPNLPRGPKYPVKEKRLSIHRKGW